MKLQIVEKKFKRGKIKGQSYYSISAATPLTTLVKELGKHTIHNEVITALDCLFHRCTTEEQAREKLDYLKNGHRKDFNTSQIRKALDAALKRGDKVEARKLFKQLI